MKRDDSQPLGSCINLVLIDQKEIENACLTLTEAAQKIADQYYDCVAINVFDMDAVTTTSDGLVIPGAITAIVACDRGMINPDYGCVKMVEVKPNDPDITNESHLKVWRVKYPGKKMFRGPDLNVKITPAHNAVITGRCINNNSGTEMMDGVTMREMLFLISGETAIMRGEDILIGMTGGIVSVGIGMVVGEKNGRIMSRPFYRPGDTAHASAEYAQTLKSHIPCIASTKELLAEYILDALDCGMIPARDIGCSPAVMAVAKHYGKEIAIDNITQNSWDELDSVGFPRSWVEAKVPLMSREEIIKNADKIIPGIDNYKRVPSASLFPEETIQI
jgi:hypothetical protein